MDSQTAPVNVIEDGTEVVVTVPVPGAVPDSTRVEVERDWISIHAKVRTERDGVAHRRQWQAVDWEAETDLPASVDPDSAVVQLLQGILTITAQLADGAADARVVITPGV